MGSRKCLKMNGTALQPFPHKLKDELKLFGWWMDEIGKEAKEEHWEYIKYLGICEILCFFRGTVYLVKVSEWHTLMYELYYFQSRIELTSP